MRGDDAVAGYAFGDQLLHDLSGKFIDVKAASEDGLTGREGQARRRSLKRNEPTHFQVLLVRRKREAMHLQLIALRIVEGQARKIVRYQAAQAG